MSDFARGMTLDYLRQQAELGMPDIVFDNHETALLCRNLVKQDRPSSHPQKPIPAPAAGNIATTIVRLPANRSYDEKRNALVALYRATENCKECVLGGSRRKYVFGAGNAGANLMIIGEAPGEEDDRDGLPFIGPAGKLLSKMLIDIHIDRQKDAFITNVCKCRPPANRTPEPMECACCLPVLRNQIEIIAPKVLLLLGRVAAHSLLNLNGDEPLAKLRGNQFDYNGIPVIVTYHPSALLRNQQYIAPAVEDFKRLATLISSLKI
jgi:DNA polymerase